MPTYSFQAVSANIAGPTGDVDMGYGSQVADEGISIEPATDTNTMTIGADGEGMHSLHANKAAKVVVRFLKTSDRNALLMAMYNAQRATPTLWGNNVITVRNSQANDLHLCREVAFSKKPGVAYKTVGDFMEWTFDAIKHDSFLGKY